MSDSLSPAGSAASGRPAPGTDARRIRGFYDALADDYHRMFRDWSASIAWQGEVLSALIRRETASAPGTPLDVLDCTCGIGTQSIALAGYDGLRLVAADLSPASVFRARAEAADRGLDLPVTASDMRALPFTAGSFDVVLTADNGVAHLLTPEDLAAALGSMRRVLRPGGLLLLTMRDYAEARASRPTTTWPQLSATPDGGREVTVQVWDWHPDGDCYDLEHIQLLPAGDGYQATVRRATSRAWLTDEVAAVASGAGFTAARRLTEDESGFYQPVLVARAE